MNRRDLNRRRFLKAVGATALTYPFLRSLPSYAQPAGDPVYLILVFTPCGCVRPNWGAVGPARSATAIVTSPLTGADGGMGSFRSTFAQFEAAGLTNQTILLDGLNVATADGSHEAGMAALWTGQFNNGPTTGATSISIDQAIAQELNAGTAFDTIPLMVRSSEDFTDTEVKTRMIYGSSGGAVGFVEPIDNPIATRSTVFPSNATSSAGSSASGPNAQSLIQQAVFAQTNKELTALEARLCTEDRIQLQSYQAMWQQLDSTIALAATQAASCSPPEAIPSGFTAPLTGPASEFPTTAKLQMDLLALALACDLTRIGSLQFSTATSQVTHSWIDSTQTDIHHQYSHDGPTSLYSLAPYTGGTAEADLYNTADYSTSLASFPMYTGQLANIDIWYASQIAYLANQLAKYSTVSGKNLLSQSVICWGSELDMGSAHNHDDTPFVLIGGGGGKLKTGQLVQFPLNLINGAANSPPTNNRFHNDLLVTLAQVMGATGITSFGTPSGQTASPPVNVAFNQGPITQVLNT